MGGAKTNADLKIGEAELILLFKIEGAKNWRS